MIEKVEGHGQAVREGKKAVSPGVEPFSAVESKPRPDHNPFPIKLQLTAFPNHPAIESAAKPQPDDTQTHHFCGNNVPMNRHVALSRVVAPSPSLSKEEQQRVLAIVCQRDTA